jgi:hypothetical protein
VNLDETANAILFRGVFSLRFLAMRHVPMTRRTETTAGALLLARCVRMDLGDFDSALDAASRSVRPALTTLRIGRARFSSNSCFVRAVRDRIT